MSIQMSEEELNRAAEKAELEMFKAYCEAKCYLHEINMERHEVEILFNILVNNSPISKISIIWKRELKANKACWSIKNVSGKYNTDFAVAMLVNKVKEIADIFSFEFYSNTFSTHMLNKVSKEAIKYAVREM